MRRQRCRRIFLARDAYLGAQHNGAIFLFGLALLVAPVVEQGRTTREVYLLAGTDRYNFWSNERLPGGQTVTVAAPIDTLPLFVRAGSILPTGVPVESTTEKQALKELRVYPGADANFDLYNDDGTTYAYEKGAMEITHLGWSEAAQQLTHTGAQLSATGDVQINVVRAR